MRAEIWSQSDYGNGTDRTEALLLWSGELDVMPTMDTYITPLPGFAAEKPRAIYLSIEEDGKPSITIELPPDTTGEYAQYLADMARPGRPGEE